MSTTTLVRVRCSMCEDQAEHIVHPVGVVEPEQTLRGAPVCARCFLESEES